jgi:hypothetical protein
MNPAATAASTAAASSGGRRALFNLMMSWVGPYYYYVDGTLGCRGWINLEEFCSERRLLLLIK